MLMIIYMIMITFFLVFLLKVASILLAEASPLMREELTPYECGFEHHNMSRMLMYPFLFT